MALTVQGSGMAQCTNTGKINVGGGGGVSGPPNLVQNGDFEEGSQTNTTGFYTPIRWTDPDLTGAVGLLAASDAGTLWPTRPTAGVSGLCAAMLGSRRDAPDPNGGGGMGSFPVNGRLAQTITGTVPGATYTISFLAAAGAVGDTVPLWGTLTQDGALEVWLDGSPIWSSLSVGSLSTTAYARYEVQIVAPADPPVLSFTNNMLSLNYADSDVAQYSLVLLDDVRVNAAA